MIANLIDDIWGREPMFHLRILQDKSKTNARVLEICDCGMSGNCKPLARITLEGWRAKRAAEGLIETISKEST